MNRKVFLFLKRMFDIVISILLLILLSPIIFLVTFLIKMNSDGPAVFVQKRVGLNGRTFSCYKFRSMRNGADQKTYYEFIRKAIRNEYGNGTATNHIEFKTKDNRLTAVGKIIRLTSFDEIPQLLNVIAGDMSLIGPRPDVPESVQYYTDFELKRLNVKPGITGWWQVNGRSHLSLKQMFVLDNYYVDNQNLWLDVKIFFKTIYVVIMMKGSG